MLVKYYILLGLFCCRDKSKPQVVLVERYGNGSAKRLLHTQQSLIFIFFKILLNWIYELLEIYGNCLDDSRNQIPVCT